MDSPCDSHSLLQVLSLANLINGFCSIACAIHDAESNEIQYKKSSTRIEEQL